MNRAQRRSKRKATNRLDKASAWEFIESKLQAANLAPNTDAETTELMAPYYACMVRISQTGTFDRDDFNTLNILSLCGYNIGRALHQTGDAETREALKPTLPVMQAASDALEAIGNRYRIKGKWGATGDDLQALRDMAGCIEQLMNVARRGLVVSSLIKARESVDNFNAKSLPAATG